jgi:hypothetical protein
MATPPGGYAPAAGQSNNRHLVILRNGSSVLTYASKTIPSSTYSRGDLVSRKVIRNEPFDQARSVTNTSGVVNVGTTTSR